MASPPEKKTILVVEDDERLARGLRERLEAADYRVVLSLSGDEGLKLARSVRPDLILTELLLPRLDGFTFTRLLKADRRFEHIPVIMISARQLTSDVIQAREVGVAAYVTKPFAPPELLALIGNLLKNSAAREFRVHRTAPPPKPEKAAPPPRPSPARKRILIVEEGECARALKERLEAEEFEVILTPSGDQGLKIARSEEPDLILIAAFIPRLDGYTIARLLKFDSRYQHIPVLLLSSYLHPYDAERGSAARADGHLPRSTELGEMIRRVKEELGKPRVRKTREAGPVWIDGSKTLHP